ncbi:MAG: gamma-glutamyltransferase [Phycisphaerales bacterium]|nr:gamma-glutamyltransferase [Phycisphaerales bacterium]
MQRASFAPHALLTLLATLATIGCAGPGATARSTLPTPPGPLYPHAAVAADHVLASEAGLEMLRAGGNAVDAAVAASFTLSVVRPFSCGIGGGGFMVIARPGADCRIVDAVALNYREVAPAGVDPMYFTRLDDPVASRFGVRAAGVPGTVAGLLHALEHYGTLDRATVLAPAIRIARDGFAVDDAYVGAVAAVATARTEHPAIIDRSERLWTHLCKGGTIRAGDIIQQPEQAHALELIAEHGAAAFYRGPIGDAIVATIRAEGGAMRASDLASYEIRTSSPLRGRAFGCDLLTMPPPSSGGIAIQQIFGLVDRGFDASAMRSPRDPAYVHLLTESMKHAFADRAAWLADDAFVDVPVASLLDASYLDALSARIDPSRTHASDTYGSHPQLPSDGGTSHLSIVDASGMAVACTETINLQFGSLVMVPGFGIVLNDEMDDFTTIPGGANAFGLVQSDANLPAPGKRPLSSMSPTIALRDGRVVMVAGASGGPRIISGTAQVLLNGLVWGDAPNIAVTRPRVHHQWAPDVLWFESFWPDDRLRNVMSSRYGHATDERRDVGVVQVIRVMEDGILATSDPRKGGRAAGM